MSLYTRGRRPSFGMRQTTKINKTEGLSIVLKDSPLSSYFVSPVTAKTKNKTKAIYNYMIAMQVRQYKRAIDLPREACQAHIKRALKVHSPEYVCRAVRYASMISHYPYSISFALRFFKDVGKEFDVRSGSDKNTNISSTSIESLWSAVGRS